jgi:hypothetical protein
MSRRGSDDDQAHEKSPSHGWRPGTARFGAHQGNRHPAIRTGGPGASANDRRPHSERETALKAVTQFKRKPQDLREIGWKFAPPEPRFNRQYRGDTREIDNLSRNGNSNGSREGHSALRDYPHQDHRHRMPHDRGLMMSAYSALTEAADQDALTSRPRSCSRSRHARSPQGA